MKTAIYPGSFDPVTLGHLDVMRRAAEMFDRVVALVMVNSSKSALFSIEERVNMIEEAVGADKRLVVDSYDGLLIDYCKREHINAIVRGLRAVTDFDYELQIAQTNRELSQDHVDTVFFITDIRYSYLSSSVVKEIASYNGNIRPCVTEYVADRVYAKYGFGKEGV